MQKIINITTKTVLAIIAAFLATGCIFEKMDMPKDLQNVLIQVNVSSDSMQTKAEPTEAESAINSLHVYAFYGDILVGYYQGGSFDYKDENGDPQYFLMDLTLPNGEAVAVDFYLIANASSMLFENSPVSLDENMTKTQLEALRFTSLTNSSPMPLYCKETKNLNTLAYSENNADGHTGHLLLTEKVSFMLSRSLAKLSVYGAKPKGATTSPQILSVEMLSPGTREFNYLFPQVPEVLNAVESRANNRRFLQEPVSVQELSGDGTAAEHFTPVMTTPTYLSEVLVGGTPGEWAVHTHVRQVVLMVEYVLNDEGALKTVFINMPPIKRNTHYKVCILISEENEGTINITYEVEDWNNHEMPQYSFTYPSHSYIRASILDVNSPSSPATMSETSPFVGYFQMTAPTTEEWQPTLTGNNASRATIKVYKEDTNTEVVTPIIASPAWYKIEVTPSNEFKIDETVNLAITYQPDFTVTSEYLLVNGTSGNFYWPGSEDANYITITMVN